ncbi:hypothetical protein Barb6_02658 [Bacteroidales bacterium Barb6]|nr:hypothetical protein Barb6_02658 [Bacteroidales bacterium Barb6]
MEYKPENVTVKMPAKKPEGKQLSDAQKEENKKISSFRILVKYNRKSEKVSFSTAKQLTMKGV